MKIQIANITQHLATPEQAIAGVRDLGGYRKYIMELLTFEELPSKIDLSERATIIAKTIADLGYKKAMIGGAPFFMSTLENALKQAGITPVYAFSVRESVEQTNPDGSITKTNVFNHLGFVEA